MTTCDSFYAISKTASIARWGNMPSRRITYPHTLVVRLSQEELKMVRQAMQRTHVRSANFGRAAVLMLTQRILNPSKQEMSDED
jgi:hypothetical protein